MRFGTFHLIGAPHMTPAEQRVRETLEQISLADELGFDHVWVAEHHFSNYGYSVNPLILIAKASAYATRVRFGQAVIVTPFWQPVRLAEDIALTDILTSGRLDLGLGRGYQPMEFEGLGLDIADNTAMFQEGLDLMAKCWSEDDFTFQGRHYRVERPTTVFPRPIQQPHPPIWIAAQSPSTMDWTADQGYFALTSASTTRWDELAAFTQRFRERRAAAGHARPGRIANLRFVHVTESEGEAREAVWQTRWQRRVADHLRRNDQRMAAGVNEAYPIEGEDPDEVWWDRLVYGTPDRCIAQIRRDQELGYTDFIGWFDIGGLPGEQVLRSIRLFAEEVIPALQKTPVA